MMIVTAVLGIGFIFALAGDFVMWAKLDEQRKATAEERDRRWDEISRAVGLENELERSAVREAALKNDVVCLFECIENITKERDALQDRLSALLCPHNDHVWQDGVCVKCGRVKDATD